MRRCDLLAKASVNGLISPERIECLPQLRAWPDRLTLPKLHCGSSAARSPTYARLDREIKHSVEREHYLEGFRRAGLD